MSHEGLDATRKRPAISQSIYLTITSDHLYHRQAIRKPDFSSAYLFCHDVGLSRIGYASPSYYSVLASGAGKVTAACPPRTTGMGSSEQATRVSSSSLALPTCFSP
jgi:hypothetical protein